MAYKPIRIAQVVGKVVLGGVDAVVMNYYRHIDRTKFQFDFFMDGLDKTPIDDEILSMGGRIFKLPPYEQGMKKNLVEFCKILKNNNYKIVHCHMNTLSVFWLREAKKSGVPVRIAHNHSTAHWREGKRTLMKYALRPFSRIYPTHFCACAEHAGRWLFGNRLFDKGKITILRNAIETDRYAFNPDIRERVRAGLGLQDKFVVGHIGRFVYPKNHKFLIKIFAQVAKQEPNAILMLVGDGELKPEIEQMTDELGIRRFVRFLGVRQDVQELYQAMDVFVLPSLYEGLPVVGIEAQASGLPFIMSDRITKEAAVDGGSVRLGLNIGAD
ncbi:MAG: glycosyltransferase family 1 protein, partial [Oscillospiraceae bacterium]|nr:glycosyltransferase family 1 protein [Oscillospiraceae bacterium]